MRKLLRKINKILVEFLASKPSKRGSPNLEKSHQNQTRRLEGSKTRPILFQRAVRRAKRDSLHSFVESMNSQTPTDRLVKIIRRNETVCISNVIKHNGEFTKSLLETLNYLLDILSPGSQQINNQATRSDLVNNLFMRPEDTKMIANICSFESIEAAINESQPFKAPRARRALFCTVTERLESTERILPCHFSSMPETPLCAIDMKRRHKYIFPQTRKGKLF